MNAMISKIPASESIKKVVGDRLQPLFCFGIAGADGEERKNTGAGKQHSHHRCKFINERTLRLVGNVQ